MGLFILKSQKESLRSLLILCHTYLVGNLFSEREGVEARLHPQREKVHVPVLQNQKGGQAGRNSKKGGDSKPGADEAGGDNPDRHGLLGLGE